MFSRRCTRACRVIRMVIVAVFALGLVFLTGLVQSGFAQTGTNPLILFKNYFVTGDYVVAGWVEGSPDGSGYAPGSISFPDLKQPSQNGVPTTVPKKSNLAGESNMGEEIMVSTTLILTQSTAAVHQER
jgi:hypothetical protein